jgi:C-terminal processing protease CtpA/Prc
MKPILIAASLALLLAVPAVAGENGMCTGETQACLDYMANQLKNSGWVGVEMDVLEEGGCVLTKVVADSPAEAAGLQVDDVLLAINGIEMNEENREQLQAARAEWKPGTSVTWSMSRGSADRQVAITLGRMPADVLAKYIGRHMLEHATVEVASK